MHGISGRQPRSKAEHFARLKDYHDNMDGVGFGWWLDNRLAPAFKSGQESIPLVHGASAKQGSWGQSTERAGCWLQAVLQQQLGLGVRAQAQRISTSTLFSVSRVSSFLSLPRVAR